MARPLPYSQIDKADALAAKRLATHPKDEMARTLARAVAALRTSHEREEVAEDAEALAAYKATRDEETFPAELVYEILDGANKLRAYRKYRGYTLAQLAGRAGLSVSYISDIERGRLPGSIAANRKLAAVLDLDLEDLV